jgi:hypothetical protein
VGVALARVAPSGTAGGGTATLRHRQHDLGAAWAGAGEAAGGPARPYSVAFDLIKCFQMDSNLTRSKDGLLVLQKFQQKYGCVYN